MPDLSALDLWAGLGRTGALPLHKATREESKVQQGTKPEGGHSLWLMWRRESCVLGPLLHRWNCTENSLTRILEENLYYIHKQYSVFFSIWNLAKVELFGQSWRNGFCPCPRKGQGRKHRAWDIWALVPLFYQSPLFMVQVPHWLQLSVTCLNLHYLDWGLNPDLLSLA